MNAPPTTPSEIDGRDQAFPGWYVHQSLQDSTTPSRVVHYVRETLSCDRVTLLAKRGRRWKVIEVSGVTKIHRHSQTVRAIESSAKELLAPGELQIYPEVGERSETEELAIDRLLDATGANYWVLVPLRSKKSRDNSAVDKDTYYQGGQEDSFKGFSFALLCERFEGEPFPKSEIKNNRFLWENAAVAIQNWRYLNSIPAASVQSALGKLLGASAGLKMALIAMLLLVSPLVLRLVPMRHWVESYGQLKPAQTQNLYASSSATVMKIHVTHGQIVEAGQALLELESSQILQLRRELVGQLQVNQEQLVALKSQQISNFSNSIPSSANTNGKLSVQEANIYAEVQQLESTIANLQSQLVLVESDLDKLTIRAPFRGRIATWDVEERLHQRPVRIGDWLLTIEPVDATNWTIELELPPNVLGVVLADRSQSTQKVKFRLGTAPNQEFDATLESVGSVAQASERHGISVLAKALVNSPRSDLFQSGTDVRAQIDCGESNVWLVWTHDLRHWWNYHLRPAVYSYFGMSFGFNDGFRT